MAALPLLVNHRKLMELPKASFEECIQHRSRGNNVDSHLSCAVRLPDDQYGSIKWIPDDRQ